MCTPPLCIYRNLQYKNQQGSQFMQKFHVYTNLWLRAITDCKNQPVTHCKQPFTSNFFLKKCCQQNDLKVSCGYNTYSIHFNNDTRCSFGVAERNIFLSRAWSQVRAVKSACQFRTIRILFKEPSWSTWNVSGLVWFVICQGRKIEYIIMMLFLRLTESMAPEPNFFIL